MALGYLVFWLRCCGSGSEFVLVVLLAPRLYPPLLNFGSGSIELSLTALAFSDSAVLALGGGV